MQHSDIEQLLVDIHAAKAFLDRVEFKVRNLTGGSSTPVIQGEDGTVCEVSSGSNACEIRTDKDGSESKETESVGTSSNEIQPDLFDLFGSTSESKKDKNQAKEKRSAHAKGVCTLTRRQVLANFREIVGDRKILDLADVNRIFGYNKSTSGTFVKHAIKRGELGTIPYGAQGAKFLMIDVRRFIKQYFDRIEAQKNGGVK